MPRPLAGDGGAGVGLDRSSVSEAGAQAGHQQAARPLDRHLDRVGWRFSDSYHAGFTLSAHVLPHSFCTNLVRAGHDLILVAELAGHRCLDTTRRYSLPSAADKQAAIDAIAVDY
jgi:site-specific recombinase XerD